jgi:tetratricopeptide (TPR) repeat protein
MKKEILFVLLLLVSLFFVYQKTLNYDLIWDTNMFIHESILFNRDVPIFYAFKTGYIYGQLGMQSQDFYYRPVLNLTFLIEKKTWGLRNVTLRLTNIFIFLLGILLLFIFLKRQEEDPRFAATATLLFALSPFNIENIVWVVGRGDLLMFLWGLSAFLFFDYFREKKKAGTMVASIVCFALGVFSKETFIFFWPVLVAYELIKSKKITWIYHSANALIIIFFFFIKNAILGIGNLGLVVGPGIFEYIKTGIAVFGYYCRLLAFPFFFDNFNFVNKVTNSFYGSLGILSILIFILFAVFSRKERKNWFPLVLFVFFILPYVALAFSTLWPFRISSRYMMIPFLGVIWLAARYLCRLRLKLQNIVVIAFIVLFGSAIISGSNRYRSEKYFWNDALKSHPDSSFVLLQLGDLYFKEGDDFSSLQYYIEALRHPMGKTTAIGISLGMAKIFFQRSDYSQAQAWLDRIQFEILPYTQFHICKLRARILIAQGNTAEAEKILKDGQKKYGNRKDLYSLLYDMYIGFSRWEEAEKLEKIMRKIFPSGENPDTEKIKREFHVYQPEKKVQFYFKYNNYRKALDVLNELGSSGFNRLLLRVELLYRSGNSGEALNIVNRLLGDNPGDFQLFNSVGFFYLKKMNRMHEAISMFQASLKINPDQAGIMKLLAYLLQEQRKLGTYVL